MGFIHEGSLRYIKRARPVSHERNKGSLFPGKEEICNHLPSTNKKAGSVDLENCDDCGQNEINMTKKALSQEQEEY